MRRFIILFVRLILVKGDPIPLTKIQTTTTLSPEFLNNTRRILSGKEAGDTRPYMVYLRAAASGITSASEDNWTCGGVIVHERYILTSAACIEDAKHFYVVSGTHKWIPFSDKSNDCINYGAKKAVWKCVPKSYVFDGHDYDNIRWMIGDIAIVKVEDDFNFQRRVRGCDFVPQKVAYNNQSIDFEKAGSHASISGWGSTATFSDVAKKDTRSAVNSPVLLEAEVQIVSSKNCERRWPDRYHYIIKENMICTKDSTDTDAMSTACSEHEVNCKELVYSDENEERDLRKKLIPDPSKVSVHTAVHYDANRRTKVASGGFCENDHGGPLISGYGKTSIVIGVISACMTREITRKCFGPFLFTSVWRYRNLISCAIDKDISETSCRLLLRAGKTQMSETTFDWTDHPDGPAKDMFESITMRG